MPTFNVSMLCFLPGRLQYVVQQVALAHEFARTVSRIEEMQTVDYLRQPRVEQHGFRE